MPTRALASIAAAFVSLVSLVAAAEPAAAPAPPPADPSKAEGRFKNIQVLKGYPADDVVPSMQFISASLGVDCDFCHVERAPEKDDKKEKGTARKMMAMTQAINKENFDNPHEVTCVSCHRGAPKPAVIPAIDTGERPHSEPAAAKTAELPAASAVLDKYLQALGGADALSKIASRTQKGKLTGFGPEPVPVDVASKAGLKRLTTVHNPHGENITAVNEHGGWLGNTGRPPRDMTSAESDGAHLDAALLYPSDVKKLFKEFEVKSVDTIDGRKATKLVAKNEDKPPAELWFDEQSGLLVRMMRYVDTPLGTNPTQVDIGDYRDADGVKVPFRWTVARPSGHFTIQIDDSRQNVPVDDASFEKPAAPPPPSPPPS